MTHEEQAQRAKERVEATGEQKKGRAEQTVGDVTDDRAQEGGGLADEVKGKLREAKSRLQKTFDDHHTASDASGRH